MSKIITLVRPDELVDEKQERKFQRVLTHLDLRRIILAKTKEQREKRKGGK